MHSTRDKKTVTRSRGWVSKYASVDGSEMINFLYHIEIKVEV